MLLMTCPGGVGSPFGGLLNTGKAVGGLYSGFIKTGSVILRYSTGLLKLPEGQAY